MLECEEVAARKAALQRESAAELEARRQGLSEQERSSATLPVPTLTGLRLSQMKSRKVRHRNHVPQDGQRGSLVQMRYVLLNATSERAEAWSAPLALVHVGTGMSCLTAVQNTGVGAPENNLHTIPTRYLMQLLASLLELLCLQTVIVQTDGDPVIREMTEELAEVRQKPTRTRTKAAHSSQSCGAVESAIQQIASTDADARCMVSEVWGVYRNTSFVCV